MRDLVALLEARRTDDTRGIHLVDELDAPRFLSFAGLWRRALERLGWLREQGLGRGDEVVIQIRDAHDFLVAVWAAILGGMVPVPIGVARYDEQTRLLRGILARLARPVLLSDQEAPDVAARALRFADIGDRGAAEPVRVEPDDVALIQFSSGSTGDPKGVVLTHANIVHNTCDIARRVPFGPDDRTFTWMPLTHDMGLIGMHFAPLAGGSDQYFMLPGTFLRHPERWIEAAARFRATVLATANFGLEHFLRSGLSRLRGLLDLSALLTIGTGSDPVSPATCRAFAGALARHRLRPSALYPIYGLSEATVGVTFPDPGHGPIVHHLARAALGWGDRIVESPPGAKETLAVVEVGYALDSCTLRVTGPDGALLPEETVGALELRGANVARRYYGADDGSTLTSDGWLPTGDLGFLRNGQLVIIGRTKDVAFVAGQNVYLHDVDRIAKLASMRDAGACIVRDRDDREGVVVALRFEGAPAEFEPIARRVSAALAAEAGLPGVRCVAVERLPKTTSGKLRRHELAERLEAELGAASPTTADVAGVVRELVLARVPASELASPTLFRDGALPSIVLVELAAALSERLGIEVHALELFTHPSVDGLIAHLAGSEAPAPIATAGRAPGPEPVPEADPGRPEGAAQAPRGTTDTALTRPGLTLALVGDNASEDEWLAVPALLHHAEPAFVPDDLAAVRQVFDPSINAAFDDGVAARWIARDAEGRPLGRIAAFGRRGRSLAGFGFFVTIDDVAVSGALLDEAARFARSLGAAELEGPTNFGERDRFSGLLVEGFARALPLEVFNPAYYAALLANAGLRPHFESLTFRVDLSRLPADRLTRAAAPGLSYRALSPAHGERFVSDVLAVYRDSFDPALRIKPLDAAELTRRVALATPTTAASEVMIAYRDEAPVGFIAYLVDAARGVKVYGLAVVPGARLTGVDAGLVLALAERLAAAGHREAYIAGVARYSARVTSFLGDVLGAIAERVHVTYRKDLFADVG